MLKCWVNFMRLKWLNKIINLRYYVEMPYDNFLDAQKIKMHNVTRKEDMVTFTTNKKGIWLEFRLKKTRPWDIMAYDLKPEIKRRWYLWLKSPRVRISSTRLLMRTLPPAGSMPGRRSIPALRRSQMAICTLDMQSLFY